VVAVSAVLTNARLVTSRKFLSRTTGFSHSSLLDTSPWVKNEGRLSKHRKSLTTPLPWALRSRVSRLSRSYGRPLSEEVRKSGRRGQYDGSGRVVSVWFGLL